MKRAVVVLLALLSCSFAHAQNPEPEANPDPGRGPGPEMDRLLETRTFSRNDASLPYRLLKPEGYDKDGQNRYPLVVFLHGMGERGDDNKRQLINGVERFVLAPARKKYPCFLLVPQCPSDDTWSPLQDTKSNPEFEAEPNRPLGLVVDLIESLSREFRIDPDRLYLTGISMGGYGTWDMIARHPDRFAAAMPVCGGGDPSQAEKLARLPIWAFHGARDSVVPPERTRAMIAAIRKAGGRPIHTEFDGAGHDSWTPTYRNQAVLDWLFAQRRTN